MQFLSPIYLFGVLAVIAPILIHLIRRRKFTVVQWAAHRFLVSVTKKLQKRKKIDDLILLLLRCLLFVLLALLFARPFFGGQDEVSSEESSSVIVLLDASASMNYSSGVRSRFEEARSRAASILTGLPESALAGLILFADRAHPVVSPPTSDHSVVLQELERQSTRPGRSNLAAGLAASLDALEGRRDGRVVLITDGQATAWRDSAELAQLMKRVEEQSVVLDYVDVAESRESINLGVTEFVAINDKPVVNQPVRLSVVVENGGDTPSEETRLVLEKEEGMPVDEIWIPKLQPGESSQMPLRITFSEPGWKCLTVRLSGDYLTTDNSRTIGILVTSGIRVGVVEGPRNSDLTVDPGFFLSAASVPVPAVQASGFPVQVTELRPTYLTPDRLKDFDVLILAGVVELTPKQGEGLERFVESGGGLWVNPPSGTAAAKQFAKSFPLRELLPVTEMSLVEGRTDLPKAGPYDHPITAYWNSGKAGSITGFFSDRYLDLDSSEEARPVLSLSEGNPLFLTRSVGSGRVFLSGLPLDGGWSDLPISPQFVPLVQRTLEWLSGSVEAPASLLPGESWRVQVPAIAVGSPFYVRTPSSEAEGQIAGQVEFQAGQAIVAFSNTRSLGRYRVFLEPEGDPVGAFGVNLNAVESDLRPVPPNVLREISGNLIETSDGSEGSEGGIARFFPALPDLWILLVVSILLIGALELYLAQRFSRPT